MARTYRTPFEARSKSGRNCGKHGTCDYCASNRTIRAQREQARCAVVEPEPEPWDDAEPDDEQCRMCGGPALPLGLLGDRLHFRCRNCGMDSSRPVVR